MKIIDYTDLSKADDHVLFVWDAETAEERQALYDVLNESGCSWFDYPDSGSAEEMFIRIFIDVLRAEDEELGDPHEVARNAVKAVMQRFG
jgi:hypothetical protein